MAEVYTAILLTFMGLTALAALLYILGLVFSTPIFAAEALADSTKRHLAEYRERHPRRPHTRHAGPFRPATHH